SDGLRGAGAGGNDVHGRGPGTEQVVAVDLVENALVVRIGMHRGHQARNVFSEDLGVVGQYFQHGGEAVRREASVADEGVGRLYRLGVDAEDDRRVDRVLGGGGEDDLFGPGGDVVVVAGLALRGVAAAGEDAGGFDHHGRAQGAPGQLGRVLLGDDLDAVA